MDKEFVEKWQLKIDFIRKGDIPMLQIPWYYEDKRFKPGTVSDVGHSFRLELSQHDDGKEYRLYLLIRTSKDDGVKDDLKRGVRVATFKNCITLNDAQDRANKWFNKWIGSALEDSYVEQ